MNRVFICLLLLFCSISTFSQEKKETSSFGISFKGFVKTDLMFDSRQTVAAREGHFLLFPAAPSYDANNNDINSKANLNMLAVQSRLTGVIKAPDFLGAKTSGVIEGAFFGHSNPDVNGFRLRHAFLKLKWANTSLIVGQYWNPMFIVEVFPGVISFNTGAPFQPFARNPQIRLVQSFKNVKLTLTAASQRDFASTGPSGTTSSYLRNSVIPMLDINLKYVCPKLVAGIGFGYKNLTPQLITTQNYKTDKTISSTSVMAFAKFTSNKLVIKFEGIYGGNLTDVLMLGGYAVKSQDPLTNIEEYTNVKTLSTWGEIIYGSDLKFGLFAGYSKNMGAEDNIVGTFYSRGSNIANLLRISPRIQYRSGNVQFATELEYTSAAYGTADSKGKVQNTTTVANTRLLVAGYLFF